MSTPRFKTVGIVGAGAMGMAFVDTLISETDATVVLVDRNDQPGDHIYDRDIRAENAHEQQERA